MTGKNSATVVSPDIEELPWWQRQGQVQVTELDRGTTMDASVDTCKTGTLTLSQSLLLLYLNRNETFDATYLKQSTLAAIL